VRIWISSGRSREDLEPGIFEYKTKYVKFPYQTNNYFYQRGCMYFLNEDSTL
jgi:hypothetical protein